MKENKTNTDDMMMTLTSSICVPRCHHHHIFIIVVFIHLFFFFYLFTLITMKHTDPQSVHSLLLPNYLSRYTLFIKKKKIKSAQKRARERERERADDVFVYSHLKFVRTTKLSIVAQIHKQHLFSKRIDVYVL